MHKYLHLANWLGRCMKAILELEFDDRIHLTCKQSSNYFIDAGRFRYPIFPHRSAGFEALVGDYSALPRRYLPENYRADAGGLHIGRHGRPTRGRQFELGRSASAWPGRGADQARPPTPRSITT